MFYMTVYKTRGPEIYHGNYPELVQLKDDFAKVGVLTGSIYREDI